MLNLGYVPPPPEEPSVWYGLFGMISVIVLLVSVVWFIRFMNGRRGVEQRGFEVNLNSGGEPEAKKKENDHG